MLSCGSSRMFFHFYKVHFPHVTNFKNNVYLFSPAKLNMDTAVLAINAKYGVPITEWIKHC